MKQIIREILEGKFRYDNASLDFSCPRIEMSIQAGERKEDSFTIYGPKGVLTEGLCHIHRFAHGMSYCVFFRQSG